MRPQQIVDAALDEFAVIHELSRTNEGAIIMPVSTCYNGLLDHAFDRLVGNNVPEKRRIVQIHEDPKFRREGYLAVKRLRPGKPKENDHGL